MSQFHAAIISPRAWRSLLALGLLSGLAGGPTQAAPTTGPSIPTKIEVTSEAAQNAYRRAVDALARGDLDEAQAAFQEARERAPQQPGPYLGLAEVASRKKEPKAVAKALTDGIAAAPHALVLHLAYARFLFISKRYAEATAALDKAVLTDPGAAQPHIDLGDIYLTVLKVPTIALEHYQAAVDLAPDHAGARYGMGRALVALDRFDEAKTAFETAQRLAPTIPQPSVALGEMYAHRNDLTAAITAYEQAVRIDPKLVAARIGLGAVYEVQRRFDDAAAAYQAALAIDDRSLAALSSLAMLQHRIGHLDDAMQLYRRMLGVDPNQVLALNNLAFLSAERKMTLDEALTWAKKAVALAPDEPAMHTTLGWVYRQRGELGPAATELTKAVRMQESADRYYYLGQVYVGQRKTNEARTAFQNALRLAPGYKPAQDALALLTKK